MPTKDTSGIKKKIVSFLKEKGPSLPVHIAKEIGMDMLFTSAFLSELLSDGKIKISHLKVGNSRLYLLSGQEEQLENFSRYLNHKEKEAFELLKEKKFVDNSKLDPAIRIAMQNLEDFAKPIDNEGKRIWKYFTAKKEDMPKPKQPKEKKEEQKQEETKTQEKSKKTEDKEDEKKTSKDKSKKSEEKKDSKSKESEKKEDSKEDKSKSSKKKSKKKSKRKRKRKRRTKKNKKFFNQVKTFLDSQNIEIIDIQSFSKKDLMLKVKKDDNERILIAYNKKRVNNKDIIKAYKKASEEDLPYLILSKGKPYKKTQRIIKAVKNLKAIKKIK